MTEEYFQLLSWINKLAAFKPKIKLFKSYAKKTRENSPFQVKFRNAILRNRQLVLTNKNLLFDYPHFSIFFIILVQFCTNSRSRIFFWLTINFLVSAGVRMRSSYIFVSKSPDSSIQPENMLRYWIGTFSKQFIH